MGNTGSIDSSYSPIIEMTKPGMKKYKIPGETLICYEINRKYVEEWNNRHIDVGDLSFGKSVYILESRNKDGEIDGLYAGQTDIRRNGPIGRMFEHLTDDTSNYDGPKKMFWTKAYIFVSRLDGTDTFSIKNNSMGALENWLRWEIPDELCRTKKTPPEEMNKFNKATSDKLRVYLYKFFPEFYEDDFDEDIVKKALTVRQERPQVVNLSDPGDKTDTYTTPPEKVADILDILEDKIPDIWSHDNIFIDPACKGGEFLAEIYNRLVKSPDLVKIKNESGRARHIGKYQLYGIATNEKSYEKTLEKLEDLGVDAHIALINDREYVKLLEGCKLTAFGNSGTVPNEPNYENYLDYIMQRVFKKSLRDIKKCIWKNNNGERAEENMKLTVMVGNPPYQKNLEENSKGFVFPTLYDKFLALGTQCCNITSLLVPAKWTGDGKADINKLRDQILHEGHLRHIRVILDSSPIFGSVSTGKLTHFVYDNSYDGLTDVEFQEGKETPVPKQRDLKLETGALVDNRAIYIYTRIKNEKSLLDIVSNNVFGIWTNDYDADTVGNLVNVLTNKGMIQMDINRIPHKDRINKYKCYVSRTRSEHAGQPDKNGQYKVLSKHGVLKPNEACSDTYFVIGNFDTEHEALNCNKFICTKFLRLLVLMKAKSTIMSPKVFADVPLQNFGPDSDIDWTQSVDGIDRQLYKKYKLTQQEIDYIEKTIKPMN